MICALPPGRARRWQALIRSHPGQLLICGEDGRTATFIANDDNSAFQSLHVRLGITYASGMKRITNIRQDRSYHHFPY
jgi:hypothetical protein